MKMVCTVEELVSKHNIPQNHITKEQAGDILIPERLKSGTLKIDLIYQRLFSPQSIVDYGPFRWDLCVSTLISRRPAKYGDHAGDYIIDGQHKGVMHHVSGLEVNGDENTYLPCQVKIWPDDINLTLDELRAAEAELFFKNNVNLKKLTKVAQYRAGVVFKDEESILIESHLKICNLVVDNFGSEKDDALKLQVPSPFFYIVLNDIKNLSTLDGAEKIKSGLELYQKIWPEASAKGIHGQVLRTMVLLSRFIEDALTNSKQKKFKTWVEKEMIKQLSPKELIAGYGAFSGPQYALHERIIGKYNDTNIRADGGKHTIRDGTIKNIVYQGGKKPHPDFAMFARPNGE